MYLLFLKKRDHYFFITNNLISVADNKSSLKHSCILSNAVIISLKRISILSEIAARVFNYKF